MPTDVLVDPVFRVTLTNVRKSQVDKLQGALLNVNIDGPDFDAISVDLLELIGDLATAQAAPCGGCKDDGRCTGKDVSDCGVAPEAGRQLHTSASVDVPEGVSAAVAEEQPGDAPVVRTPVTEDTEGFRGGFEHVSQGFRPGEDLNGGIRSGADVDREMKEKLVTYIKVNPWCPSNDLKVIVDSSITKCRKLCRQLVEEGEIIMARRKTVLPGKGQQYIYVFAIKGTKIPEDYITEVEEPAQAPAPAATIPEKVQEVPKGKEEPEAVNPEPPEVPEDEKPLVFKTRDEADSEKVKKILKFVEKNPGCDKNRMINELGLSYYIIRRLLDDMIGAKQLKLLGRRFYPYNWKDGE